MPIILRIIKSMPKAVIFLSPFHPRCKPKGKDGCGNNATYENPGFKFPRFYYLNNNYSSKYDFGNVIKKF